MFLFKEGDRSEAICPHCETLVTTRLLVRTLRLDGDGEDEVEVPGVLAGVCDRCDNPISLPAQSIHRVGEALKQKKEESLEARIPTHLEDVIHLLANEFEAPIQTFRPSVLRFYLREFAADAELAERVAVLARSDFARAPGRARISLRAPEPLLAEARERARRMGIETDAQMLRGILLAAKEDVLDGGNPERILRLGGAAQAEGAARPRPPRATAARGRASTRRR